MISAFVQGLRDTARHLLKFFVTVAGTELPDSCPEETQALSLVSTSWVVWVGHRLCLTLFDAWRSWSAIRFINLWEFHLICAAYIKRQEFVVSLRCLGGCEGVLRLPTSRVDPWDIHGEVESTKPGLNFESWWKLITMISWRFPMFHIVSCHVMKFHEVPGLYLPRAGLARQENGWTMLDHLLGYGNLAKGHSHGVATVAASAVGETCAKRPAWFWGRQKVKFSKCLNDHDLSQAKLLVTCDCRLHALTMPCTAQMSEHSVSQDTCFRQDLRFFYVIPILHHSIKISPSIFGIFGLSHAEFWELRCCCWGANHADNVRL